MLQVHHHEPEGDQPEADDDAVIPDAAEVEVPPVENGMADDMVGAGYQPEADDDAVIPDAAEVEVPPVENGMVDHTFGAGFCVADGGAVPADGDAAGVCQRDAEEDNPGALPSQQRGVDCSESNTRRSDRERRVPGKFLDFVLAGECCAVKKSDISDPPDESCDDGHLRIAAVKNYHEMCALGSKLVTIRTEVGLQRRWYCLYSQFNERGKDTVSLVWHVEGLIIGERKPASRLLERVHSSDVCEPIDSSSWDGSGVYVSSILVTTQLKKIKLMTNQGRDFLRKNGVSESSNWTAVDKYRTMMFNAKVSKKMYPTAAIAEKQTPVEHWTSVKPDLEKLRLFGCLCFVWMARRPARTARTARSRGGVTKQPWRLVTCDRQAV